MTRCCSVPEEAPAPTSLSDEELLATLRDSEVARRRLYAAQLRTLAEIDARGLAQARGYGGAGALVRELFTLSPVRARRLLAHARAVADQVSPSGAPVSALLPETARALADGRLGEDQVEAIHSAMATLPTTVSEDDRACAERILCEAALSSEPRIVARLGREIQARLYPDGTAPSEPELAQPKRWLVLRQHTSGELSGSFSLDAETASLFTTLLSPLTAPSSDERGPLGRTRQQRQGDAFAEILRLAAHSPRTPHEAGEPVTLLVSTRLTDLRNSTGHGLVDGHLELPASQIRRLACDAKAAPVVLGSRGEILDIGRASRTVPRHLRRALIHRDGGCTFPGCDRKAKWCHAHHVRSWADGGPTALDNLALLCGNHHRLVHHTEWEVRMINGRPWFIPPAHHDPDREPLRNTLHTHRVRGLGTTADETRRPRCA